MSIENAKYTNESHTEMQAVIRTGEELTHGIHPDHRLWRKVMGSGVAIANYEAPVVDNTPSFRDDLIDALTGTPAEQALAKARLKSRKP